MASRTVQLPDSVFKSLNQFKIRLATSIGTIPTTGQIINALVISADRHYDEIVDIIKETSK